MAELKDGEKSWMHAIKPVLGQYTYTSVMRYLGISSTRMQAHMKALDIPLEPYIRTEAFLKRQYKTKHRHLTAKEAARIIERQRMLQGRSVVE